MDKENSRSAAGLRRSAIAERIRLREEWSALKGTTDEPSKLKILRKKVLNNNKVVCTKTTKPTMKAPAKVNQMTSDVLRGVVALVEVGAEPRALALRAALAALGASVVPSWSPLVTHLIWAEGGCRATRAKGRALASRLVSPLWVEACAASNRRLPEQTFPAAARASDLPSPRTLRRLLKQAEMENIPLVNLLSDSKEEEGRKANRLRISSETDQDTSADKTTDTSRESIGVESRVNTAPRRALPISLTPTPGAKRSRRKLFTQKEADSEQDSDEEEPPNKGGRPRLTQRDRRDLARAERMAKRLVAACTPTAKKRVNRVVTPTTRKPRVVLTGMSRSERQLVCHAIRSLHGRIQKTINRRTTHVLLGSCKDDDIACSNITGVTAISKTSPVKLVSIPTCDIQKARTLNALVGAARGCRVLYAQWALDCLEAKRWLHHIGYEVAHLKKISQKARVERKALGRMFSEYAYDVFNGMRIRFSTDVGQKDAADQLLSLCGGVVIKDGVPQNCCNALTQNGGRTQNGGPFAADFDVTIGSGDGEVSTKWVFDSVAAGRMRTTRRYVNSSISSSIDIVMQNRVR